MRQLRIEQIIQENAMFTSFDSEDKDLQKAFRKLKEETTDELLIVCDSVTNVGCQMYLCDTSICYEIIDKIVNKDETMNDKERIDYKEILLSNMISFNDIVKKPCEELEIKLPLFGGFYSSVEDSIMDDNIQRDIEYYKSTYDFDINYDNIDHKSHRRLFCTEIVDQVNFLINKYLCIYCRENTHKLFSPKEYNFSNDQIYMNCLFDTESLLELVDEHKEEITTIIEKDDRFNSHSGYICLVSNNINDWYDAIRNNGENKSIYISTLIQLLFECNIVSEESIYYNDDIDYSDLYYYSLTECEIQPPFDNETEKKIREL